MGSPTPRIAPPPPARSHVAELESVAAELGITLMPWQHTAGRYLTATRPDGRSLYSEVAIVVARQQGKTTLMKPAIVRWLRAGQRILHIAQTRELPREMFNLIADAMSDTPELFPKRCGKTIWPRYGAGQEEIILTNGGTYRIAAANRGGARGRSNDKLLIDELREMETWDVVASAEPTLAMSPDPQRIYLSNAGTERSVILNALRERGIGGNDPTLAYLEWSAAPERSMSDRDGWAEADPALGHYPQVERNLEEALHKVPGPVFETERLCRWVATMLPLVVPVDEWELRRGPLPEPSRPCMGIAVDPEGRRASAVIAWTAAGKVYVRHFAEAGPGGPIDLDAFATDLLPLTRKHRVRTVGFNPWTDRDLARHFPSAKPIQGADHAAASARVVSAVASAQLVHDGSPELGADMAYTVRAETPQGWHAVRANADRPTTASLAMLRAVWLASEPGHVKSKVW